MYLNIKTAPDAKIHTLIHKNREKKHQHKVVIKKKIKKKKSYLGMQFGGVLL